MTDLSVELKALAAYKPMYVMTPEFGAASQQEKIAMHDFAEFVTINQFDRKEAADALLAVGGQYRHSL